MVRKVIILAYVHEKIDFSNVSLPILAKTLPHLPNHPKGEEEDQRKAPAKPINSNLLSSFIFLGLLVCVQQVLFYL